MNREQVKQAILKTAGYPESGAIKDIADALADAIIKIDEPEIKKYELVKETRVVESNEVR
jgi:hypothetical protein